MTRQRRHGLVAVALAMMVTAGLSGCGPSVRWSSPEGARCDRGAVVAKVPIHNDGEFDITVVITGTGVDGSVELGRQVVPAHSVSKVPMRQAAHGRMGVTVSYSGVDATGRPVGKVLASFRGPNNNCAGGV